MIRWLSTAALLVTIPTFAANNLPARCIGEICISPPNKEPKRLLQQYGKGSIRKDADDPTLRIHCYYDARQQVWFELELEVSEQHKFELTGIFVTKSPMCPVSATPLNNFPDFVSEHRIRIGATEAEVVKKMGKPQRIDDVVAVEKKMSHKLRDDSRYASKFGTHRLVYEHTNEISPLDLRFNFYGLTDGRVTSIWFADRE